MLVFSPAPGKVEIPILAVTNTSCPLTSKGSAGVAGAALVVLAGTLSAAGRVPLAGVVLVLGIHRFMGQMMAVTNTIGNSVATIVIGRRCGQVDEARLREELGD